MKKSRLLVAVCTLLAMSPFTASATTVSIVDHGIYTTVTNSATNISWDWLDITQTTGLSYNYVTSEMGAGGLFEGWRYATRSELEMLWTDFGGDPNYYSGWSVENDGLFNVVSSYLGDALCERTGCTIGRGVSRWITADIATAAEDNSDTVPPEGLPVYAGQRIVATMNNLWDRSQSATEDYANLMRYTVLDDYNPELDLGSALVRISAAPVPAAGWLFGSGLLGLVGMARRKKPEKLHTW